MMRRVDRRRRTERRSPTEPRVPALPKEPATPTPQSVVLRLQTDTGNAAVARLLARQPKTAESPGPITSPSQVDKPAEAEEPPVTKTGAEGAQDWFDRAVAHYDAGRYEKALYAFEQANKLFPQPNFLYNQAACLDRLGRKDEAAAMYGRYLAANPSATDAEKVKKRIAKLRGQTPKQPEQAHEAEPERAAPSQAPIAATAIDGARAWFDRGQKAYVAGDFVGAAEDFKQAFLLKPLPHFVFNEGVALEKGGRPAAAANAFEHYLVLEPGTDDREPTIERIKNLRG